MPTQGCQELARRLGARTLYLDGAFSLLEDGCRSAGGCCVKVTSGSDGLAKGIACRAEHLIADGGQVAATMGLRPGDRNFAAIPFGHSYGLGNLVLPLILQGTGVVAAKEYVPRQLLGWLEKYHVTVLPLVPALARILAEMPGTDPLAGVRKIISAGAVLSPAVAQAFYRRYGRKIHNFYGSSETGGICYDRTGAASLSGRSVGHPLTGVEVKVSKGRVTVRSAAVAAPGRRWVLPDVGEWNARGELVLLGRRGSTANIGGKKVHPREIEQVVREIDGVSDVFVWLRREGGRDVLCSAVETSLSLASLEEQLAGRLPVWKIPKRILAERELARTARGKLDTTKLRQRFD
jgi:acyl-CoA synthetase (AMP-forming)/AMP-acid ligase II